MPFPVVGALAMGARTLLRRAAPAAARVAGRAVRHLTRGRLLGQGGGRAAVGTLAGYGVTAATAGSIVRSVRGGLQRRASQDVTDIEAEVSKDFQGKKTYRRMNPANGRALRRAIRRLEGAERIFKKVFRFNHGTAATKVRPRPTRRSA